MMGFIPIMSPVSSGGTIGINSRTPAEETLNISSHSLVLSETLTTTSECTPAAPQAALCVPAYHPDHVYINISGIQSGDLNPSGVFGANVSGRNWIAYINLTPRMTYFQNYSLIPPSVPGGPYSLSLQEQYNYNRSDITITVRKGGATTLQDFTVYSGVTAGTVYAVDLMDEAYGIHSLSGPRDQILVTTEKTTPSNSVQAACNITYDFSDEPSFRISPIPLGSIEYRAQNNYWIPQDYYYQMGGVFLSQIEGNVSYRLPPEISFANDTANELITVNINALSFNPGDRGLIGGNSPVQIKTRLESVYPVPYVPGDEITGNTKRVWIGINTSDPRANAMWESYFDSTARTAGISSGVYTVGRLNNESYIEITGQYADSAHNDIRLMVTNATFSTWVHGVGGVYE
jgi:hypothetical protein